MTATTTGLRLFSAILAGYIVAASATPLAWTEASSHPSFMRGLERPASLPVLPERRAPSRLTQNQRHTQSLEATCEIIKDAYLGTTGVERAACQECYVNPSNPSQYILFCDFANFCSICSPEDDVCYNLTRKHTVQLRDGDPYSPRGVGYSACGRYLDNGHNVCLDETYDGRGYLNSRCVSLDDVSCETCEMDYSCGRFWFGCDNLEPGFWMHDCDYSINDSIPKSSLFIGFNYAVYDADTTSCFDDTNGRLGNIDAPTTAPSESLMPSFQPSISGAPSASQTPSQSPSDSQWPSSFVIDQKLSEPSAVPSIEPSFSFFPSLSPSDAPSLSFQPTSESPSFIPSSAPTEQVSVPLEAFSITLSLSSKTPNSQDVATALSKFFFAQLSPDFDNLSRVVIRPVEVESDVDLDGGDSNSLYGQSSNTYRFEGEAVFFQIAPPAQDVLEHEANTLEQLETLEDDWVVSNVTRESEDLVAQWSAQLSWKKNRFGFISCIIACSIILWY